MSISEIMTELTKAARTVAYKWPSVTTEDDMLQDLSARLLESQGSIAKLVQMSPTERLSSLIRIGNQIASAERDDFETFSGQYRYSVDEVRSLLEAGALNYFDTPRFTPTMSDLVEAFDSLAIKNVDQINALANRYINGVVPNKNSSERKALNRAVEALTREMNRGRMNKGYQYKNGGRFRNNSSARKQTDADYFGVEEVI